MFDFLNRTNKVGWRMYILASNHKREALPNMLQQYPMIMSYFHILKSYFISTYIKNQWISELYRLNLSKKNYFIYFNILFNNISYITFFILRLQHIKITYKNSLSKKNTNQPTTTITSYQNPPLQLPLPQIHIHQPQNK